MPVCSRMQPRQPLLVVRRVRGEALDESRVVGVALQPAQRLGIVEHALADGAR